jgi:hypothetical protein
MALALMLILCGTYPAAAQSGRRPPVGTCGPKPTAQARFGITCAWEEAAPDSLVPPQCCCVQLLEAALAAPWVDPKLQGTSGSDSEGDTNSTDRGRAPVDVDTGTRCFPHAIVVGAQKGGTTATFAHFLMRPDFEAPRAKEVGLSYYYCAHTGART